MSSKRTLPLYSKVKDSIVGRIASGEWGVGYKLPSENELVETLKVSRMTVHRALRELSAAGVLRRMQGSGTFVAETIPRSSLLEVRDIADEIRERGHVHSREVLKLEETIAPAEIVPAFQFSGSRAVFHSIILHYENEVPVQVEERYVNKDLVPRYLEQDFSAITSFEYLSQSTPLTEVEHVIESGIAGENIAALLRMRADEPCLILGRRTWTGSTVATVSRFVYPGLRYRLGSRYKA